MKAVMLVELKAIVKGSVQGVSFRRTVRSYAEEFGLTGYARNLENGDVEICAQGSKETLEKFIKKIQENPGRAVIQSVSVKYFPLEKTYSKFEAS